jgi:hypothetical protein
MSRKIIEMLVSPGGEVKLQTFGFVGSSCQRADQFLRDALGVVSSEELTPEYHYQTSSNDTQTHTESGGDS